MVAPLPDAADACAAIGVSLGSPCVGVFLPVWLEAPVPSRLALGGAEPDDASPWWRMRGLLDLVERDAAAYGPAVRTRCDAFEAALWEEVAAVERQAAAREHDARAVLLGRFADDAVDRWLRELDAITATIR